MIGDARIADRAEIDRVERRELVERVLPWREAAALVRRDAIENAFTLIALYWLKTHRAALRRMWLGAGAAAG